MSRRKYQSGIPWGAGMIADVEFMIKVRHPQFPPLPDNLASGGMESSVLNAQYSFNLEREILFRHEQFRQAEQAAATRKLAEAAAQELQDTRKRQEATDLAAKAAAKKSQGGHTAYLQSHSSNQILTPLRSDTPVSTKTANGDRDSPSTGNHNSLLKDFDQADNPFDVTELKTLNDMEELRGLLYHQTITTTTSTNSSIPAGVVTSCAASSQSAQLQVASGDPPPVPQRQPPPPPPQSYPLPAARISDITFPRLEDDGPVSTNPFRQSPRQQDCQHPGYPHSPSFTGFHGSSNMSSNPFRSQASHVPHQTTQPQGMMSYSSARPSVMASSGYSQPPTSHSDDTTMIFDSLIESPPTFSSPTGAQKQPTATFLGVKHSASNPPTIHHNDPYNELDTKLQCLVDRAVSMGFPRDQSARFISTQTAFANTDNADALQQALIGHVTRVAEMEGSGVPAYEAERALHLFPDDPKKALQFIHLSKELQEFGFPSPSIQEVLLRANLDRERAVYLLQSLDTSTPL